MNQLKNIITIDENGSAKNNVRSDEVRQSLIVLSQLVHILFSVPGKSCSMKSCLRTPLCEGVAF